MKEYTSEAARSAVKRRAAAKALQRKKRRRRQIAILCVELFLLVMVLGCMFVLSKWDLITHNEIQAEVNEGIDQEVEEAMSGYTTYALFGVDSRDVVHLDKGVHGDVVMICSINNRTGEI